LAAPAGVRGSLGAIHLPDRSWYDSGKEVEVRRILTITTLVASFVWSFATSTQAATVTVGPSGEFQVDGEPFLPIMQWLQSSSRIAYQKELGINTFVGNGGGNSSAEYLAECEAQGVWCVMDPADMSVSNDPALFGWIFGDEPDLDSNAVEPSEIEAQYEEIKQADPKHPTLLTLTSGFFSEMDPPDWMNGDRSRYSEYAGASDAVGFDLYPVYGWCRPDWLYYVGASQEELVSQYAPDRATYQWIECVRTSSQWCDLDERAPDDGPTPAEVRNEVWQAIVHGAKAIGYFTHSWECPAYTQFCLSTEQEAELERTNAELTALTIPILSAPYEQTVTVTSSSTARIDWATRRVASQVTLIAVNVETSAVDVSFEVPGLISGAPISVHDEDRALSPVGESFTDSFEPLAVHIYDIAVGAAAGAGGGENDSTDGTQAAGSAGDSGGGAPAGGHAEGGAGGGASVAGGAGSSAIDEPSSAAGAPSGTVDEPSGTGGTRTSATGGTSTHDDETSGGAAGAVDVATNADDGGNDGGCGCTAPAGRVGGAQASLFAALLLCAFRRRRTQRTRPSRPVTRPH
jgi:hypothetical protein